MSDETEARRKAILEVYRSASWADKVSRMSDEQVTAIYLRFKREGKVN